EFAHDGTTLLARCANETTCRWEVKTGALLERSVRPGTATSAAHQTLDRTLRTGRPQDAVLRLWDISAGAPLPPTVPAQAEAISPDGRLGLITSAEGPQLFDVATGAPVGPPRPPGGQFQTSFRSGGEVLTDRDGRVCRIPRPLEGSPESLILWT